MKASSRFLAAGSAVLLFLFACQMDISIDPLEVESRSASIVARALDSPVAMNPDPSETGPPPPATVPLKSAGIGTSRKALQYEEEPLQIEEPAASLTPAALTARLRPGESITESKTAFLPSAVRPPMGDILISFDLTNSMYQELNNIKNNAQNILAAVRNKIPDTRFGLVSHMDYNGYFESPGYEALYGSTVQNRVPDYPYRLDLPLTDDAAAVAGAIEALELGAGGDIPEDYTRVFYESYSDPEISWRTGARKIMLAWLDAIPHDPDFAKIYNPDLDHSTGVDPGRDEVAGTQDDLEILPVLNAMKSNDIILIVVYSNRDLPESPPPYDSMEGNYWGTGFPLWEAYSAVTGGSAFRINYDGTIPGGTAIEEFVAGLVSAEVGYIDEISLQITDPTYSSWLTTVTPGSYSAIELDQEKSFDFDIVITVPYDASIGTHEFTVALMGDSVLYAEQSVIIEVYDNIEVFLDVKPGSCPNPVNVNAGGVLPVAIAGTESLDISHIDPATVRLNGIAPLRWSFEDVTAPFEPYMDKALDEKACMSSGPDGYTDLTLKFSTVEIAEALGTVPDGRVLALELTGKLFDGTPVMGEDMIRIIKKK